PNNEVTLWDQTYVAAALFKSAVAGAVLEGGAFPWAWKAIAQRLQIGLTTKTGKAKDWNDLDSKERAAVSRYLKTHTRWRLLTVGIGMDHYEARTVRIGDWIGARADLDAFFDQVCRLVEVDLAIGSLLFRDA